MRTEGTLSANRIGILKRFVQCIGLSSLILLVNYVDLLNLGQSARFHSPVSLAGLCVAQVLAIVLLGSALFLVRVLINRWGVWEWARLVVIIVVPPYLVERVRPLIAFPVRGGILVALAVLWAAIVLLLLLRFPKLYRSTVRLGDAIGIFAAAFGVLSIVQIVVVMTWRPGPQVIRASWQSGVQPPREHARVVWIVFDELSYNQVFEHRAKDLALPNFDHLRDESTTYTDMQPVGLKTAAVIPSLLSGRRVDDDHFTLSNKLLVRYDGERPWQRITGHSTVFYDAQRAGWRTAVVGWYNPYCTVYGDALDSCYWSFLDRVGLDMTPDDSIWTNTMKPFSEIALQIYSPRLLDQKECDFDVTRHLDSQLDLDRHALTLLQNDQADFIFLHFAVPHSPNVWSRVKGSYERKCGSSYLDNLALADRTLGGVLATIEHSPRWKDTTVVVEGDHSWRVMMWDWLPSWTPVDEQASDDAFDPRPALLIHQAGQTEPRTDSRPLSLLFVHQQLEDVLHAPPGQAQSAP